MLFPVVLVALAVGAQAKCQYRNELVSPCTCLYNQLQCHGKKIDDQVLRSVFANLTAHTPLYLANMKAIEIVNTKVKSINPSLFGDIKVTSFLRVSGNKLDNFSIGNFDRLVLLDISNNVFANITPSMFIGLNQLRVLHAANIGLKSFQKEHFSHLRNLEKLDLSGNNLRRLQLGSFSSEYENNFQLSEIDLSGNRLEYVPQNIFLVMRQPRLINLASNRLHQLDEIFRFSSDIVQFEPVQIILSNNSLKTDHFTNRTFANLFDRKHYINLDLTYNNITWLDQGIFGMLIFEEGRNVINVNHNPFQCSNCRNRWLFADQNLSLLDSIIMDTCIEKDKRTIQSYTLRDFRHCGGGRSAFKSK